MKLPPGLVADWPSISELLDEALALPRAERERWGRIFRELNIQPQ